MGAPRESESVDPYCGTLSLLAASCRVVIKRPDSQTARQPDSQTARQRDSETARQPHAMKHHPQCGVGMQGGLGDGSLTG